MISNGRFKHLRDTLSSLLPTEDAPPNVEPELEWYRRFRQEIEAIGGWVDHRRDADGNEQIHIPRDKQAEAAEIVKRFSVQPFAPNTDVPVK